MSSTDDLSEINLPNIKLNFKPFCKGCNLVKVKFVEGMTVYGFAKDCNMVLPGEITCESLQSCTRIHDLTITKSSNEAN